MHHPSLINRFSRAPQSLSCELEGETVLLNAQSGKYFKVNSVGSHIWKILEQDRSLEEIMTQLRSEYEMPTEKCESQTLNFLEELLSRNLISTRSA